jgi:metallo-beta-lactamase family protein
MIDVEIPKHSSILGKIFKKKIHILYTGDLGRVDNPICEKPATNMPAPDYLYLEATYGDRRHEQFNTAFQELSYVINRTVERGGKIIIPSFAV